jgi:zinc D-Ala-D-Ala carboxypeptidase
MEMISKYVSCREATHSDHADAQHLANTPDADTLTRMRAAASAVFDPVREHFDKPIGITSFYRSTLLNYILKGAANSQHIKGEAIDIDGELYETVRNSEIFQHIKDNLIFDQLIYEFGNDQEPDWVHVSYSFIKNRKQVLRSFTENGKTVYRPYI